MNPRREDELRPEYQSSDFGQLVRGKHVERLKKGSNVPPPHDREV
jgi:hypothetical protein